LPAWRITNVALVTGTPPNRPGRRSNGCAKPPLRPCKRSRGDRMRVPPFLLTAKAKERFAGQSMRWRPSSRQQAEARRVCSRRHFAQPFNATRSGSASATEEGFARGAEYPGATNPDSALNDEIACKTNALAFGTGLVLSSVDRDCLCSKWKTFSQQGD
jgi:hypothetical protein